MNDINFSSLTCSCQVRYLKLFKNVTIFAFQEKIELDFVILFAIKSNLL